MRPVQRRIIRAQKKQRNNFLSPLFKVLVPLVLVISFLIFFKMTTNHWDGKSKFGFTFMDKNGNAEVVVLDPKLNEMTTLVIPAETEVEVARNYGTLRIKNVWKLSQNEKLKGSLLPETITQNFLFPITLWTGSDGENINKSSLPGILAFVFTPKETNINFGDRLSIGLFSLRVHDVDKTQIDMGKSQFLRKEKLNDGQVGYKVLGGISERLGIYFTDESISSRNLRVYITDATGQVGVSSLVGQIVEVMGGKVVSIDKKKDVGDFDCEILGADKNIDKKIADLFMCKITNAKTDFDLEIRLGSKFANRF